jgi:diguanylate cyclase (GGDEF)-like protein
VYAGIKRTKIDEKYKDMDSLLRHMVDLTGHRDHITLDLSVIAAVQELADADSVRMLGLSWVLGNLVLVEHATLIRNKPPEVNEYPDVVNGGESIALFPELGLCLEQRDRLAERFVDGQYTVWLPVWLKDKANVCIEIHRAYEFDSQMKQIMSGIISVYRNFQNLLEYSERDALTGLFNRKTFDSQLARMLTNSVAEPEESKSMLVVEEERRQFSYPQHWLAVVDVDHFKRVNDQFGHVYGDEVLILLSNLMQSSFRSQDRVFRFGGEEFVVLLRSTSLNNARKSIERFRQNVENHSFPKVGQITASIGFVAVNAYDSPVVILGHADQALYYAKTHGRNMVCHYDELVNQGLIGKLSSNEDVEFF